MLSDLPRDLADDVLSRLPGASVIASRCVSKTWNTLSKKYLAQATKAAAAAKEFMVVMLINHRLYLKSLNLHGIHNSFDLSINHQGKLVSLTDSDRVPLYDVYHCDGLLLCVCFTEGCHRFFVWNPYIGQTRWLDPINSHIKICNCRYAMGYEDSKQCRSYKVLRFGPCIGVHGEAHYEIYYINSKSSRDITITIFPDWLIRAYARGVSLKGNTYWFAQEMTPQDHVPDFLICFDFTTERFGPRLSLPFQSSLNDTVTLSSVRDEQLAVLHHCHRTLRMEIWITGKIEPEVASWNKVFLAVDMKPLTRCKFGVRAGSFFVDEEKKVVVVFDSDKETDKDSVAYIIGKDGYFKKVDFEESSKGNSYPLMCSYVPSSVQIKGPARGIKRKKPEC